MPASFTAAVRSWSTDASGNGPSSVRSVTACPPVTAPRRFGLLHRRSVNLRGVDPEDARDARAGVAVAVGEVRLEEEGVAGLHTMGRAVDEEVDLAFEEIADGLALMRDRIALFAVRLDVVDIGFQQV